MNEHLAFAQCLQRVLNETELTATEVARRLEMRSRNSIFRILLIFAYVKCHCVQTVLISFHQFLYRLSHESLLYQ